MQNKYRKKCIELAKKISKERANYICEKCGRSKKQGWQMHGAHIIPVNYSGTCADPYNILCLCAACHSIGGKSAHQNPVEFSRWLDNRFPDRYDKLWLIANSINKIDWIGLEIKLKIELNEIKKLCV